MSDVSNAPAAPVSAPAAPSTPAAPAAREVPINPNPVGQPSPIGPQAPQRQGLDRDGSPHRPMSRREAIQNAFDRAQEAGRPGPAEAKRGHNQPPEETPKEPPGKARKTEARAAAKAEAEADGIDLKKPPKDQPRDRGRFARAQPQDQSQEQGNAQQRPGQDQPVQHPGQRTGQQQAPRHPPLPETAPFRQPPPRFSPRAQEDWAGTPETVRGDIYRMHQEVDRMHQHYRADKETMDTIRPFHAMAQKHGTTLGRAMNNYVSMENKLRADPIGGLDMIVSNLDLRTSDGRKLGLRDVAYYILNQSPEQHKLVQSQNSQQALSHQIGQLHQMVGGLAQGIRQLQTREQHVQTRSAVDQFADTHPRFDELGDLIEKELQLGFSLEQAYQRANLLRPGSPGATPRAAQNRDTPAQTRTDKSIHGAPESPSDGPARRSDKKVGRREAIGNAIRRVNGSL